MKHQQNISTPPLKEKGRKDTHLSKSEANKNEKKNERTYQLSLFLRYFTNTLDLNFEFLLY